MKVAFVTPASQLHRSFIYRWAHVIYEPMNAISGPLILAKILADAGHSVAVYEELYQKLPLTKINLRKPSYIYFNFDWLYKFMELVVWAIKNKHLYLTFMRNNSI